MDIKNTRKYLELEDVELYTIAFDLSNKVWDVVVEWNHFAQNTVGMQLVRAVDSISANIAEGWGRFGKKDKIRFYRISKGSLSESKDWLKKAHRRNLISSELHAEICSELNRLPKMLNSLIKITNEKLKQ